MSAPAFTRLVTHASCGDGLASAVVVLDALPGIEVVFAQHGTAQLEQLPATAGLLFCDITPPRSRVAEFVDAGAVVLDHHKHARDIVEAFGARGHFADESAEPGVSGALLAYRHVWAPRRGTSARYGAEVETFARWVGIRDTWQTSSPEWQDANDLHAALMGMPRTHWLAPGGIGRAMSADSLDLGRAWRAERAEKVDEVARAGILHLQDGAGRLWAAFPDASGLVSDVAERLRQEGEAVVCSWLQVAEGGELFTVLSLRSDGSLDVGQLARQFGGGGHTRAAGVRLCQSDPLGAVRVLLAAAHGIGVQP